MSGRGNAILVAGSIYEACKFFELFAKTDLQGQVRHRDLLHAVTLPTSRARRPARARPRSCEQYDIYRQMLADWFDEPPETAVNKSRSSRRRSRRSSSRSRGR